MEGLLDLRDLALYARDDLSVAWLVSPVLSAVAWLGVGAALLGLAGLTAARVRRGVGRPRLARALVVALISIGAAALSVGYVRVDRALRDDLGSVIVLARGHVSAVALVDGARAPVELPEGTRLERLDDVSLAGLVEWLDGGGLRMAVLPRRWLEALGRPPELLEEWRGGDTVLVSRGPRGPWRLPVVASASAHHAEVLWQSPEPGVGRAWAVPVAGGPRVEARDDVPRRVHRLRFDGLAPDTEYSYGVMSEDTSRWGRLRTLPAAEASVPLRLAVIGDSGGGEVVTPELVEAMARFRPQAVLHVGDLSYPSGTRHNLRREFYRPFWPLWRGVPVFIVPGNHDLASGGNDLAAFLGRPGMAAEPVLEVLESAGVRVVGFNSSAPPLLPGPAGREVRAAIAAGSPWWRLTFFHHPPFSTGEKVAHPMLRRFLHPLLVESGVDLSFSGHVHNYQRTAPLGRDGSEDRDGVRYVITGGGGGELREIGVDDRLGAARSTFHHVQLVIRGGDLWLRARNVAGRDIDRLHLHRDGPDVPPEERPWSEPPAPLDAGAASGSS